MTNPSKVIIQTIPLRYKLATVKDMRYWILDEEGKFYKTLPDAAPLKEAYLIEAFTGKPAKSSLSKNQEEEDEGYEYDVLNGNNTSFDTTNNVQSINVLVNKNSFETKPGCQFLRNNFVEHLFKCY